MKAFAPPDTSRWVVPSRNPSFLASAPRKDRKSVGTRILRAQIQGESERDGESTVTDNQELSYEDVSDLKENRFLPDIIETDSQAFRTPWYTIAFTRRREVILGRIAMLGFLSENVGELLTGKGIFGQMEVFTGWPTPVSATLLVGIAVNHLLSATTPSSPTWFAENQEDVQKRTPYRLFREPLKLPPLSKPGFTKRNEVDLGRLAMLGFMTGVIGEIFTGKGPLAQLGLQVDSPLAREIAGVGLIAWSVLWVVVARRLGRSGQLRGDNDLY